jgi:hypothetical protein
MKLAVGVLPLVALLGCGAKALDLGGESPDGGGESGSDDGGPSAAAMGSPLDGVWTGYLENGSFPSGADGSTMTLNLSGGVVTGTMVFGSMTPPPPPTDPNVGYPPGASFSNGIPIVGEGFPYTIEMGTFDGSRLRVGVGTREVYKGWCAIQQSFLSANGGYTCLMTPAGADSITTGGTSCYFTNSATQMTVPVDCGKYALCTDPDVCSCTASGCTLAPLTVDATFDMQVVGSKADGSAAGAFGDHNAHFTRQ